MTQSNNSFQRNTAKDILAWSIIFGGSTAVKSVILAAAVSGGLINGQSSLILGVKSREKLNEYRREAWRVYKDTGKLWLALKEFK